MFIHNIDMDQDSLYWITIAVCAVVLMILSYMMFEYIVIFSTSLIGAYSIVRGISLYAGGFPNEGVVISLIKNNETEQLNQLFTWRVYVYLAAILLTFIIGVLYQSHSNNEKNKKTGDEDKGGFYIKIDK